MAVSCQLGVCNFVCEGCRERVFSQIYLFMVFLSYWLVSLLSVLPAVSEGREKIPDWKHSSISNHRWCSEWRVSCFVWGGGSATDSPSSMSSVLLLVVSLCRTFSFQCLCELMSPLRLICPAFHLPPPQRFSHTRLSPSASRSPEQKLRVPSANR